MINILLIFILIRPFISSSAFPALDLYFSLLFLLFSTAWILLKGLEPKKISSLKFPLLAFCASLIISVIFSKNRAVSAAALSGYAAGLVIFLIAASLRDPERKSSIRILLLSALAVSLLALYQYFIGFSHLRNYLRLHPELSQAGMDYIRRGRVFLPFVTANILGGYLATLLPLFLIDRKTRWLCAPLILALLLSQSLGALSALLCGSALFFFILQKPDRKKLAFFIAIALAAGGVILSRMISPRPELQPHFSGLMKFQYWRATLRIIRDFALTGVGIGNFNLPETRYAHNAYLQIWAETGIIGLGTFFWFLFAAFKKALGAIRNAGADKSALLLFTASVIFLIHNLVDFSFFLPETSFTWWLILGLLAGLAGKK